jgi:hypothetical protein
MTKCRIERNGKWTEIEVWFTKTGFFRARIKEKQRPAYEVTVGGKSWAAGLGREYQNEIRVLIDRLNEQHSSAYGQLVSDHFLDSEESA